MKEMIPDFKTYLNESVWGDIRKKSLGKEERKEDDIETLSPRGLYEYILSYYRACGGVPLKKSVRISPSDNVIEVDVYERKHEKEGGFKLDLEFYSQGHKAVKLGPDGLRSNLDMVDTWLLNELKDFAEVKRFDADKFYNSYFLISPKDGSETTNKFFLRVLDYLIDAKKDSVREFLKLKRKSKV